jgi:hypothetical protein
MTALITSLNYSSNFKTKLRIIVLESLFFSIAMLSLAIFLGFWAFLIETYKIDAFHEGRMSLYEIVWKFGLVWLLVSLYIFLSAIWITLRYKPIFDDEDFLKRGILKVNPIAVFLFWPLWLLFQIGIHAFIKKDLLKIIYNFFKEFFTDP